MGSTGGRIMGRTLLVFVGGDIGPDDVRFTNYHPQAVDRLVERVISARTEDSS